MPLAPPRIGAGPADPVNRLFSGLRSRSLRGQSWRMARTAKACDQASGVVEVGMPVLASTRSGSIPAGVAARRSSPINRSAAERSPRAARLQAVHAVGAVQGSTPPSQPWEGTMPKRPLVVASRSSVRRASG